jgi:hypothetical protein
MKRASLRFAEYAMNLEYISEPISISSVSLSNLCNQYLRAMLLFGKVVEGESGEFAGTRTLMLSQNQFVVHFKSWRKQKQDSC